MEWKRGPVIGRGSSAAVYLAAVAGGDNLAVKSADLRFSALLRNEERLMSRLSSPYVAGCLGSDVTFEGGRSVFNLFLEYVPGGTLSDLIGKHGGSLDEEMIRFYAHQMAKGLSYLHGEGIVHCDIKGQNILIGGEGIKIVDFGCSRLVECGGGASVIAGTPAYMAPEAARGEGQGFAADVWGLGCTVIEMATGSNPWPEMRDPGSVLYRVAYSDDLPEFPESLSGAARDFLGKCLMRDPNERWTAEELLQHEFLCSVEEDCGGGENRVTTRKSPTSVIDQWFWDELEESESESESLVNTSEVASSSTSSSHSPASRIAALIGSEIDLPEWVEEEDWISVRFNGTAQESFEVHHHQYHQPADSISDDEQIRYSIPTTADSSSNYWSNEFTIFDNFEEDDHVVLLLQPNNVQSTTVRNSSRLYQTDCSNSIFVLQICYPDPENNTISCSPRLVAPPCSCRRLHLVAPVE